MPELDLVVLAGLLVAAFAAGWLDAVGGGGGLIQLPVLLLTLPSNVTVTALGTNKLASSFGTATAAVTYAKAHPPKFRYLLVSMVVAFCGSVYGAVLASRISTEVLQPVIFGLLLAVWVLNLGFLDKLKTVVPKDLQKRFIVFVAAVGFYDGLIGPGTGAFLLTGFVVWQGLNFLQASAYAKFINLSTNVAAILVFAVTGNIFWLLGLLMAGFNILGGRLGAKFAIRRGSDFVRKMLLVVVALILLRLAVQIWG